jgi:uncharacterized protein YozE (UPF0346 family)
MKPRLKLKYTDFYKGWDIRDNLFSDALADLYELEFSDDPDLLIFLPFGTEHLKYRCRKVFITGENIRPDFHICDYAFSFDYLDDPKNYRFPLALWGSVQTPPDWDPEQELRKKTRFCNFVYSNPSCPLRNQIFKKLSRYKKVDSGGRYKNNLGYRVSDKYAFLAQYKFTIAYENSSYPGYVTEKITDAFAVHSLPIYWGNPLVHRDFNPASFISFYDCDSNDAVVERVMQLDRDDNAYLEMMRQPRYPDNEFPRAADKKQLRVRFREIVESTDRPIGDRAKRWPQLRHRARHQGVKWSRRLQRWRYRLSPL